MSDETANRVCLTVGITLCRSPEWAVEIYVSIRSKNKWRIRRSSEIPMNFSFFIRKQIIDGWAICTKK